MTLTQETTHDPIPQLMEFGLTRQEATVYLCLLAEGDLNGYELAKTTGLSRSNAYTALASLVDKGAAWIVEGNVTQYSPVPPEEFLDNRLHRLAGIKEKALVLMPQKRVQCGTYLTITGDNHILDRLRHLLASTRERVYLALEGSILSLYLEELSGLLAAGCKVVVITDIGAAGDPSIRARLAGAIIHAGTLPAKQIRLIVDSHSVLTGEISGGPHATCLCSDQKNLVDLFKTALKNEIRLIELGQACPEE